MTVRAVAPSCDLHERLGPRAERRGPCRLVEAAADERFELVRRRARRRRRRRRASAATMSRKFQVLGPKETAAP